MSATYSLVCDKCKQKYWAGQSDYIYSSEKTFRFLYDHLGHNIRFTCDQFDDESTDDYEDVE